MVGKAGLCMRCLGGHCKWWDGPSKCGESQGEPAREPQKANVMVTLSGKLFTCGCGSQYFGVPEMGLLSVLGSYPLVSIRAVLSESGFLTEHLREGFLSFNQVRTIHFSR